MCMYIYVYIYMCIYMYLYIYIYSVYIHLFGQTAPGRLMDAAGLQLQLYWCLMGNARGDCCHAQVDGCKAASQVWE